eukprot:363904-Chlamydomonas_euryale.AAC.9
MRGSHTLRESLMYEIHSDAMMAPALPIAAAKPWLVARTSVGNISPATKKVEQLGLHGGGCVFGGMQVGRERLVGNQKGGAVGPA